MSDLERNLGSLGSAADIYVAMCREGVPVTMLTYQVQMLRDLADQVLTALRDTDPRAVIHQDVALSSAMRFHLEAPAEATEVVTPDDLSSLTDPYQDRSIEQIDVDVVHQLATDANLAVLVTTADAVQSHLDFVLSDEDWRRARTILRNHPEVLTQLIVAALSQEHQ